MAMAVKFAPGVAMSALVAAIGYVAAPYVAHVVPIPNMVIALVVGIALNPIAARPTSGYFKTAQDGRKLFFPWGGPGRGYVIASERDYKRLQRQVKVCTGVSLVLIIGAVAFQGFLAALAIGALLIIYYMVWMRFFLLRGLQPSDETQSLQDSISSQARAHSASSLWLLEIVSLAFVGGGIFILLVDPGKWLIALASIGFFGLCAAVTAYKLVLRRRAATTRS